MDRFSLGVSWRGRARVLSVARPADRRALLIPRPKNLCRAQSAYCAGVHFSPARPDQAGARFRLLHVGTCEAQTVSRATKRREQPVLDKNPLWYKDAVIYELHVRAFCDGNADGIGDLTGFTEKLDYLRDLGVTSICLLPFYPSPLRDDGYDIADYTDIHPDYGNVQDFKIFLREAHRRGLYVISELVINHTSDQHPWFQRARESKPGTSARNLYVWSDGQERYRDARIIFNDFESSNWAWCPQARSEERRVGK